MDGVLFSTRDWQLLGYFIGQLCRGRPDPASGGEDLLCQAREKAGWVGISSEEDVAPVEMADGSWGTAVCYSAQGRMQDGCKVGKRCSWVASPWLNP